MNGNYGCRPGARRGGQGARPRHHRARADQLRLQPRLAAAPGSTGSRSTGCWRSAASTRARSRATSASRARCARSSPPTTSTCSSAQGPPGPAEDGRPRPRRGRHLRRALRGARRRRGVGDPTSTSSAYDFGIKRSMLGYLAGARLPRHGRAGGDPARATVLKLRPDGVFLSATGPATRRRSPTPSRPSSACSARCPVFGICLGHQLLALALGLETYKLKFGHRGANHPVKDLRTGVIEITTQNHGFAVRDGQRPPRRRDHPRQPERRHGRGAGGARACTRSRSSTTPSPRRGRTTRATCSSASGRDAALRHRARPAVAEAGRGLRCRAATTSTRS